MVVDGNFLAVAGGLDMTSDNEDCESNDLTSSGVNCKTVEQDCKTAISEQTRTLDKILIF